MRSGYPLGATLHYGTVLDSFDLRISGRVVSLAGVVRLGAGIDLLRTFESEGPLSAYFGAGPALDLGPNELILDLHALIGGEFRFSDFELDPLGVFLEGSLGGEFNLSGGDAQLPTIGAALGVNWHF